MHRRPVVFERLANLPLLSISIQWPFLFWHNPTLFEYIFRYIINEYCWRADIPNTADITNVRLPVDNPPADAGSNLRGHPRNHNPFRESRLRIKLSSFSVH